MCSEKKGRGSRGSCVYYIIEEINRKGVIRCWEGFGGNW